MSKFSPFKYAVEERFEDFLEALRRQEEEPWHWLIQHFQEWVVPWLRKKDFRLPPDAIVSAAYFIEEVFAASLIRFYELFEKGEFENFGQLRGLMFTVADLKFKEAQRKVHRDKLIFKIQTDNGNTENSDDEDLNETEKLHRNTVLKLNRELDELRTTDREIIERFFNGESYKSIADTLNISEAACRKRKQRVVERLRKMILTGLILFLIGGLCFSGSVPDAFEVGVSETVLSLCDAQNF